MSLLSRLPGTHAWRDRRDRALCAQTSARIQEIVDRELRPGRAARALERHVAACERCGDEANAIAALKRAIARVGRVPDGELVGHLEEFARRLDLLK